MKSEDIARRIDSLEPITKVSYSLKDSDRRTLLALWEIAWQLARSNEIQSERLEMEKRGEQRSIEALETQKRFREAMETEARKHSDLGSGMLAVQTAVMKDAGIPVPAQVEQLATPEPEETKTMITVRIPGYDNPRQFWLRPYDQIRELVPELLKYTDHVVFDKFTNEKDEMVPCSTLAVQVAGGGVLTFHSQRGVSA